MGLSCILLHFLCILYLSLLIWTVNTLQKWKVSCIILFNIKHIPNVGRNPDFYDFVANKPKILMLNKVDLVDKWTFKVCYWFLLFCGNCLNHTHCQYKLQWQLRGDKKDNKLECMVGPFYVDLFGMENLCEGQLFMSQIAYLLELCNRCISLQLFTSKCVD